RQDRRVAEDLDGPDPRRPLDQLRRPPPRRGRDRDLRGLRTPLVRLRRRRRGDPHRHRAGRLHLRPALRPAPGGEPLSRRGGRRRHRAQHPGGHRGQPAQPVVDRGGPGRRRLRERRRRGRRGHRRRRGGGGPVSAPVSVTEYTDPGCIVSWASEPRLRLLRLRYGHLVGRRRVFGLQIADARATDPGFDPVASAPERLARWTEAARATGTPITGRLHWLHRSTGPACRAAISARRQGRAVAERVLRRLREAVYLDGRPADTPDRVRAALTGVPGLDLDALLADFDTDRVHALLRTEAAEARRVHPGTEQAARTGSTPYPGPPVGEGGQRRYAF